jgi:hypothetical protein
MMLSRDAELALIAAFVEERGVTHCPVAFLVHVPGALDPRQEARRLAMLAPLPAPSQAENRARFLRWLANLAFR